jgi:N4-gp56 family major capsid protein
VAVLSFGTNDNSTVKVWSKATEREVLPKTLIGRFMGEGAGNIIQVKDELSRGPGDRVRMNLQMLLGADGRVGNEVLESNEEAPTFYTDDLVIDQLRHATRYYGRMDRQRVVYDFRRDARDQLSDWWADRLDEVFLNHVCGNAGETNSSRIGANTIAAPTANKIVYQDGAANLAALTSANPFSLEVVDRAILRAKTLRSDKNEPLIRPVKIGGQDCYVAILHPQQVNDLRTNTSTGQWFDIQRAAMEGSKVSDNPIFSGSLGMYNGVIFFESDRIPKATEAAASSVTASTRAAVLLGAQAAWFAYGREGGRAERYLWNEESFDYGNEHGVSASLIYGIKNNEHGVSASLIYGIKKAKFNSVDHGVIVMGTYSAI